MVSETRQHLFALSAAAVFFFFTSLILSTPADVYNSPDERANATFIQRVAETGWPLIFEPLNPFVDNSLYPRSTRAISGTLVPGGFLGLPVLYGWLSKLFSLRLLPFFTPLIATFALFAWYAIVRRLFSARVALIAALILCIHPAWWYYTARGLLPNVLFLSFLLFSLWSALCRPVKTQSIFVHLPHRLRHWGDAFASGAFLGLAFFVRASEAPWILFVLLVVGIFFFKRQHLSQILLALGAFLVCITPALFFQYHLYGHPFVTGYTFQEEIRGEVAREDPALSQPFEVETFEATLAENFFPFGIHPRAALRHVWHYGISLFWWMSLCTIAGLASWFTSKKSATQEQVKQQVFFLCTLAMSVWLALWYGSWTIQDNPDPEAITLGNSYVRYWLPIFVATTVLAALFLERCIKRMRRRTTRRAVLTAFAGVCIGLSVFVTFFSSRDGLWQVRKTLEASVPIRQDVLSRTPHDAIFVVDRADKLFFPDRRIRYPLRDERTYALLPGLLLRAPVYYYGITFPEQDLSYLNLTKLPPLGLQIEEVETYGAESLYHFVRVQEGRSSSADTSL